MKLVLAIAGGTLLAGMLLWWMSDPDGFRHKVWGYSQEEIKADEDKLDRMQADLHPKLADELLDAETRSVELRYGDAAAAKYRLCHTQPPKTSEAPA
jgi:hypothetical protein